MMKLTTKTMVKMSVVSHKRLLLLLLLIMVLVSCCQARSRKQRQKAPKIQEMPKESQTVLTGTGFLQCPVTGRPKPDRRWYRDGQPVEELGPRFSVNQKTRSLRVFRAEREDSGNYTCVATNKHGNDSVTIQLIVALRPRISILGDPRVTVDEGDKLEIVCRSHAIPRPTHSWITSQNQLIKSASQQSGETSKSRISVSERDLGQGVTESVLTITSVSHHDHGIFVCYADNMAGSSKAELDLDVLFPPKPWPGFVINDTVYFYASRSALSAEVSCGARGNDLPSIEWFYNGNLLNTSHCQVRQRPPRVSSSLCTVTEDTLGKYTCYAVNSLGRVYVGQVDVQPLYPPEALQMGAGPVHANIVKITTRLGQPSVPDPTYAIVTYSTYTDMGSDSLDMFETTADFDGQGEATVKLPGLEENMSYRVTASARNKVGRGPETILLITTGKTVSPFQDLVMLASSQQIDEEGNIISDDDDGEEEYDESGEDDEDDDGYGDEDKIQEGGEDYSDENDEDSDEDDDGGVDEDVNDTDEDDDKYVVEVGGNNDDENNTSYEKEATAQSVLGTSTASSQNIHGLSFTILVSILLACVL